MDATPEMQNKRAPYGIIGLCLFVVAAIVLTFIVMAAVAAAVYFADAALHGMGNARMKAQAVFRLYRLMINSALRGSFWFSPFTSRRWRQFCFGRFFDWRSLVAWRVPLWPMRDKILWGIVAIGLVFFSIECGTRPLLSAVPRRTAMRPLRWALRRRGHCRAGRRRKKAGGRPSIISALLFGLGA